MNTPTHRWHTATAKPVARRIAVVGAGISGLAAARELQTDGQVTLFEAGAHFGGHANTVDVTLDGMTHGVDTGFLVFNHRTYPHLLKLFADLQVETATSDMSFSVQVPTVGLEWAGTSLNAVFAQRRNLLSPRFLRMLIDTVRFNRLATGLALAEEHGDRLLDLAESIGDFLQRHGFSTAFRDGYFLPMIGSIWSCPTDQMLRFPVATMVRFCHNHGLLQVSDRPQWHTVRGGSRQYVRKILNGLHDARLNTPVLGVKRLPDGAGKTGLLVRTAHGGERFDAVVLATHSDQTLAVLEDASPAERALLGSIRYHPNRAVLHTDAAVLPRRQLAWAAWNYERAGHQPREQSAVCLHYLINRLQPLPWTRPVLVSLNPARPVNPAQVLGEYHYAHPVFDSAAIAAQRRLPTLQGRGGLWFCGAWTRYGFHEDGLLSALAVVKGLRQQWASEGSVGHAATKPAA